MERITEIEQILMLQEAFNKVFRNKNPFEEMFQDHVKDKLLIYPTNGYYLNEDQYRALIKAINSIGETKIYISEVEWTN